MLVFLIMIGSEFFFNLDFYFYQIELYDKLISFDWHGLRQLRSLGNLSSLRYLWIWHCKNLKCLPSSTVMQRFSKLKQLRILGDVHFYPIRQFCFDRYFIFLIEMKYFNFIMFWRAVLRLYCSYIYIYKFNKHNSNSR